MKDRLHQLLGDRSGDRPAETIVLVLDDDRARHGRVLGRGEEAGVDHFQGIEDALLQLDRRLSILLDGVYRRGEFYLRWLERITALGFGTWVGRLVTLFVTLPFGASFLLTEIVDIVLSP